MVLVRESFIAAPFARLAGRAVQSGDSGKDELQLGSHRKMFGLARFIFALIYLLPLN